MQYLLQQPCQASGLQPFFFFITMTASEFFIKFLYNYNQIDIQLVLFPESDQCTVYKCKEIKKTYSLFIVEYHSHALQVH